MPENEAFYLLFSKDWGQGPLFKNQVELVYELLNTPTSLYYIDGNEREQHARAVSRLKAYLSQLFSPLSRRTVTPEFKKSLRILLDTRSANQTFDSGEVWDKIIKDLLARNSPDVPGKVPENDAEFYRAISSAEYISIFTARIISFNFHFADGVLPLIKALIDDFLSSIGKAPAKKYRFNLPSPDSCKLLWRALRKEIARFFNRNEQLAQTVLFRLVEIGLVTEGVANLEEVQNGEHLASALLHFVSKELVLAVYFQKAPVYLTSSVVINPYDHRTRGIYLFLQRPGQSDQLCKLSDEESTIWHFFVWERLKTQDEKMVEWIPYDDRW